jgi:serine/threonine protein kinase
MVTSSFKSMPRGPEFTQEIQDSLSSHDYTLLEQIGAGGFGIVFRVESHRYPGESFVAKVMLYSPDTLTASEKELDILLTLSHPNILRVYAHWLSEHCCFVILEYAPKGSLHSFIQVNGPVSTIQFKIWGRQILEALNYCHSRKVFHGDIKPANLLLDTWNRIKLADFGLSGRVTDRWLTPGCGSMPYMSPEMILKCCDDPLASDVWALGVTLYQIAVGRLPWQSQKRAELSREIALGVVRLPPNLDPKIAQAIGAILKVEAGMRMRLPDLLKLPAFTIGSDVRRSSASALIAAGRGTVGLRNCPLLPAIPKVHILA